MEAKRRLLHDLKRLQDDPPDGFSASPSTENDILNWSAVIFGPSETPYEDGIFKLEVKRPKY